jgi:predicted nucleic acid-binding protein
MILDTNALSAFADGIPGAVTQIQEADELHLPVIVLGEYRFGIALSRRRREYEAWLARGRAFLGAAARSRRNRCAVRAHPRRAQEGWRGHLGERSLDRCARAPT